MKKCDPSINNRLPGPIPFLNDVEDRAIRRLGYLSHILLLIKVEKNTFSKSRLHNFGTELELSTLSSSKGKIPRYFQNVHNDIEWPSWALFNAASAWYKNYLYRGRVSRVFSSDFTV